MNAPKIPQSAPPVAAPTEDAEAVQASTAEVNTRRRNARGYLSSILSRTGEQNKTLGGAGTLGAPPGGANPLTGGPAVRLG